MASSKGSIPGNYSEYEVESDQGNELSRESLVKDLGELIDNDPNAPYMIHKSDLTEDLIVPLFSILDENVNLEPTVRASFVTITKKYLSSLKMAQSEPKSLADDSLPERTVFNSNSEKDANFDDFFDVVFDENEVNRKNLEITQKQSRNKVLREETRRKLCKLEEVSL